MDCNELHLDLQRFIDDELDDARRATAEQHLQTCADCRDLVDRGQTFDTWLRGRLATEPAASPQLHAQVRARLAAASANPAAAVASSPGIAANPPADAPPRLAPRPLWLRAFASPWAPRLAMAAVLALLVAVPFLWLPKRGAGQAEAAAEQHACHEHAAGVLPPCCTAVPVGPGGTLGEPSPGAVVPDLASAGLTWQGTTRCTFAPVPVHMAVYTDANGRRFSLYMTAASGRQFGAPAGRRSVALEADAHHGPANLEVTIWEARRIRYTWVGPAGPAYDAALAPLQVL
jgi:anti-sigma factor RsiW